MADQTAMNQASRTSFRRDLNRRGLLTAVGLVAAIAAASAIAGSAARIQSAPLAWSWPFGGIPGERVAASRDVRAAVALSRADGVTADSVRRLVSARIGRDGFDLLAARGATGRVCLTAITGSFTRGFSCLNALADERAVITFAATGGSALGTTDWSAIVGVARSDVARVTAVNVSGDELDVPLNQWRAFRLQSRAGDLPAALRSYRADGSLIEEAVIAA